MTGAEFHVYVDREGRKFQFATVDHQGATSLVIHLSAFFGKWGEARRYREDFGGYFHRLKMLGSDENHNYLFLCDAFGAFGNGTYYTGQSGDLFIERAIVEIARGQLDRLDIDSGDVVTVGSSMGATGALTLGLHLRACGVVAIGPHVDLDIAATQCHRFAEVAFACPDGDPTSIASRHVTRRVETMVAEYPRDRTLPRLFLQVCKDDVGVYREQVMPLVDRWQLAGGRVDLDERPVGGHTSDYATRALLLDVIGRQLRDEAIDVRRYQTLPEYRGELSVEPRVEHLARVLRQWLRPRARLGSIVDRVRRD
jgi:hypothetical protein